MSEQSVIQQFGDSIGAGAAEFLGKTLELKFAQLLAKTTEAVTETILSAQNKIEYIRQLTQYKVYSNISGLLAAEGAAIAGTDP